MPKSKSKIPTSVIYQHHSIILQNRSPGVYVPSAPAPLFSRPSSSIPNGKSALKVDYPGTLQAFTNNIPTTSKSFKAMKPPTATPKVLPNQDVLDPRLIKNPKDNMQVDPESILKTMSASLKVPKGIPKWTTDPGTTKSTPVTKNSVVAGKSSIRSARIQDKVGSRLQPAEIPRYAINCPINMLSDKTMKHIFTHLYPADLLTCRAVQRHWNTLICQADFFLDRTVFVVNMIKSYEVQADALTYTDMTSDACLPFRYSRFQYIDHQFLKKPSGFVFRNSDNEKYFPSVNFLQNLSSIEFRNCFLLWKTVKAYLVHAVQISALKINNCHISDDFPNASHQASSEFQEYNAGNALFGMKSLEIYEMRSLENITLLIQKFNGYTNQGLETLRISYHPPANPAEESTIGQRKEAADAFCTALKSMLYLCANSLRVLYLDFQDDLSLDYVGYLISKDLAALAPKFDLREFQLSPGLDCWTNKPELAPKPYIAMTMSSFPSKSIRETQNNIKYSVACLLRLLETQTSLVTLGLPYIDYPDASFHFKAALRQLPCGMTLKYLAVPSAGYLPDELFYQFPLLKGVKIGGSCCRDTTSGWNLFHIYIQQLLQQDSLHNAVEMGKSYAQINEVNPVEIPQQSKDEPCCNDDELCFEMAVEKRWMLRMKKLAISCSIPADNFEATFRNLTNLTSFEVNSGFENVVMSDTDLQVCIKYLKKLRTLVISCADKITDYGLTGISPKCCRIMFQNQLYHRDGVNSRVWTSKRVGGRPLSDIKGLRKLVLMGKGEITDIGVGYGLSFNELKHCHLPYSDNITKWGIQRLGKINPSLETLTFTAVSQLTKDAFKTLRKTHDRMKKGDSSRCNYYDERKSPFVDTLLLGIPTVDDILELCGTIGWAIRNVFSVVARPLTMEIY